VTDQNLPQSTQVRYPGQTLLRSLVQMTPTIITGIIAFIQELGDNKPEWLARWIPVLLVVQGVLVRIMANPKVNELLSLIGLGTVPGRHSADE
jgi:hypothetical protein